jgi:hypothetical protein
MLILLNFNLEAQKQDRIWLFSDSAGIDFNDLSNPIPISSNIAEPCLNSFTCIADSFGQLLFYSTGVELTFTSIRVYDKYGNLMQNGDSLEGYPWVSQGCMIIPFPNNPYLYYLFIGNRTGSMGNYIYYNIIDISLNNGLGAVISKNNLLLTDWVNEKLNATKHANGRDWWLVVQSTNTDSLFHKFLISPNGIAGPFDQKIGSGDNQNKAFGQMIFSNDGNRLGLVSGNSTIDIFNFDRCTGELYNYKSVGEGIPSNPNYYHGCSFSPNGNVFYTSSVWYEFKNTYQYDLTATDIKATKQLIFSYPDTGLLSFTNLGHHLLGPDGKIYITKGSGYGYPNWDTFYTHHLDVIANPNNVGTACNYVTNGFDLGSGKATQGLPTMLNYNLGPVIGSICDSLFNGIDKTVDLINLLEVFPNPFQNTINFKSQTNKIGKLIIRNDLGEIVLSYNFKLTAEINFENLPAGVYYYSLHTSKEVLSGKIVKLEY